MFQRSEAELMVLMEMERMMRRIGMEIDGDEAIESVFPFLFLGFDVGNVCL